MPHLTPWLESVYVKKEARKKGLGREVVLKTMEHASKLGVQRLYLYTPSEEAWYKKMGWEVLERTRYHGAAVSVMKYDFR